MMHYVSHGSAVWSNAESTRKTFCHCGSRRSKARLRAISFDPKRDKAVSSESDSEDGGSGGESSGEEEGSSDESVSNEMCCPLCSGTGQDHELVLKTAVGEHADAALECDRCGRELLSSEERWVCSNMDELNCDFDLCQQCLAKERATR